MVLDQSYETGHKLVEGKTKIIYELKSPDPGRCVIVSKDIITAGDGAKKEIMEGKAVLATSTNEHIMSILNNAGVKTSFIKKVCITRINSPNMTRSIVLYTICIVVYVEIIDIITSAIILTIHT